MNDAAILNRLKKTYSNLDDINHELGPINDAAHSELADTLRLDSLCALDYLILSDKDATIGSYGHKVVFIFRDSSLISVPLIQKIASTFERNAKSYTISHFEIVSRESFDLILSQKNRQDESKDNNESAENEQSLEIAEEVRAVVSRAALHGVSDIHILVTYSTKVATYYVRHNGVRFVAGHLPAERADRHLRWLFQQAKGNTNNLFEQNVPNNWRNNIDSIEEPDKYIIVRYSQMPGADNVLSVTMRLSKRAKTYTKKAPLKLSEHGFTKRQAIMAQGLIAKSKGMLIVSGKTNVGKTTLNSSLLDLKRTMLPESPKFVSLEDPVELVQDWIFRVDLNEWRSSDSEAPKAPVAEILRQDADVLYVGEIRDENSGSLALSALNTGNLTLTTLHTGNCFAALKKLETECKWNKDVIYDPSQVIGVIQLNLDSEVCPHCSYSYEEAKVHHPLVSGKSIKECSELEAAEVEQMHLAFSRFLTPEQREKIRFHNPNGCEHCTKDIKKIEFIKGMEVSLGTRGYTSKRNWTTEVLSSSDVLSTYVNSHGLIEGEFFYKTIYRLKEAGAHAGFRTEEHVAHKVLSGKVCPLYCMAKYGSWMTFFTSCLNYEAEINRFLRDSRISINSGHGFQFFDYLLNPEIIEEWQMEFHDHEHSRLIEDLEHLDDERVA